jgi:hypothetical protein
VSGKVRVLLEGGLGLKEPDSQQPNPESILRRSHVRSTERRQLMTPKQILANELNRQCWCTCTSSCHFESFSLLRNLVCASPSSYNIQLAAEAKTRARHTSRTCGACPCAKHRAVKPGVHPQRFRFRPAGGAGGGRAGPAGRRNIEPPGGGATGKQLVPARHGASPGQVGRALARITRIT